MDGKNLVSVVVVVFLTTALLGIGILVGRSLTYSQAIVLKIPDEQSSTVQFTKSENTISAIGQTIVKFKSEIATLSLAVEICDKDAKIANQQVNEKLASVISKLNQAGVPSQNIVPTNFSMYSNTTAYRSEQFCATNDLSVTTTKLDKVGEYIDTAIGAGITRVYGITFTAKDQNVAVQEGVRLGMADADKQAQMLARSMGRSIERAIKVDITMEGDMLGSRVGFTGGGGTAQSQGNDLVIKVSVIYKLSD
jgi:uncharacterized protein